MYIVEMKRTNLPTPTQKNQLLSLDEYLTLARRCISVYAPKIRSGLGIEMLNNEDAIANVAQALMLADYKFDGRGSIGGYRKQCVIYAIKSYIEYMANNKSAQNTIRFSDLKSKSSKDGAEKEFDVADSENPASIYMDREKKENTTKIVRDILDSDILSDIQKKYIKMRFMENMSVIEIASACNVSRQGVNDVIVRGLEKIRNTIENNPLVQEVVNV